MIPKSKKIVLIIASLLLTLSMVMGTYASNVGLDETSLTEVEMTAETTEMDYDEPVVDNDDKQAKIDIIEAFGKRTRSAQNAVTVVYYDSMFHVGLKDDSDEEFKDRIRQLPGMENEEIEFAELVVKYTEFGKAELPDDSDKES